MAHTGPIPGLYTSDKNVDWSIDNLGQESQNNANNSMNMDASQDQNTAAVLDEVRVEKDNLGLNFVHAHRLLDAGELKFLLMHTAHGNLPNCSFDSFSFQKFQDFSMDVKTSIH